MYWFDRPRRLPRLGGALQRPIRETSTGVARILRHRRPGPIVSPKESLRAPSTGCPGASLEVLSPSAFTGPCCAIRNDRFRTIPLRHWYSPAALRPRKLDPLVQVPVLAVFRPAIANRTIIQVLLSCNHLSPQAAHPGNRCWMKANTRGRDRTAWSVLTGSGSARGVRPFAVLLLPAAGHASPLAVPHLPLPATS